jgi:SAM-dependent methyltransferase
MIRKFFVHLKRGTEYLNYGRPIIRRWGEGALRRSYERGQREFHILDIGCGHGTDLQNISDAGSAFLAGKAIHLHGIENHPPYVRECRERGIRTYSLDVEHDIYPLPDAKCDVVIANQVIEHTKEIFWVFSEAVRVLKPGGVFIVGVPNLASLHNRLLLLCGLQPTAQQSLSAHVRTFTKNDLKRFAETGGYLRCRESAGANFYPFPAWIAPLLSGLFPGMAWGLFMLFERMDTGGDFLDCLFEGEPLETPYYGGPLNPPVHNRAKVRIQKKSSNASTRNRNKKTG